MTVLPDHVKQASSPRSRPRSARSPATAESAIEGAPTLGAVTTTNGRVEEAVREILRRDRRGARSAKA